MNIFKAIKTFISLDGNTRILLLEAIIYLGWARLLLYLPFTRVAPYLGVEMQETPERRTQTNIKALRRVSNAVHIMSSHTFWESKCLVKALAGLKMLERRRIESTLYLGVAKDENGNLTAHAWLRSGSFYITGADVMNQFTVVGKYAKRIKDI